MTEAQDEHAATVLEALSDFQTLLECGGTKRGPARVADALAALASLVARLERVEEALQEALYLISDERQSMLNVGELSQGEWDRRAENLVEAWPALALPLNTEETT